jgi:predicted RecB family endonuclease
VQGRLAAAHVAKELTMTFFTENGLAIAVIGGLAITLTLVFFMARRTRGSLSALAAAVAATIVLLAIERFVQTDQEQVVSAVHDIYAAVDQNDVDGVLALIDTTPNEAQLREQVKALMPMVKVESAGSGRNVEVTLNESATPMTATTSSRAFLNGTHVQTGHPVPYVNQRVDMEWVKRGEQWLLKGYTAYFDGKPIDAVNSARTNRPVP